MSNKHRLADELAEKLKLNADTERGKSMSAYMKAHFLFLGINSEERRAVQRDWMNAVKKLTISEKKALVLDLWSKLYREYHYAAIDLLNSLPEKEIVADDHVLMEHMIVTNSWWDSVDAVASNFAGKYFKKFPEKKTAIIEKWRSSENIWLKRSCLIFQLKYGKETDFILLCSLIRDFAPIKEFFIQKAIGWALRQYAKTDPERVKNFLREIELKGVALKEATKYI
jgi:3-methyladenine DNA glycosylase AlkD